MKLKDNMLEFNENLYDVRFLKDLTLYDLLEHRVKMFEEFKRLRKKGNEKIEVGIGQLQSITEELLLAYMMVEDFEMCEKVIEFNKDIGTAII